MGIAGPPRIIDRLGEAAGDFQRLQVAVERAKRETGGPITQGDLTLSLIPLLNTRLMKVADVEPARLRSRQDLLRYMVKLGKRFRMR